MSQIENAIANMANDALRTIIIAKKTISQGGTVLNISLIPEDLETKDDKGVFKVESSGLTFISLLGIKDILREEVPGAIKTCKEAGVRVRMVTGDNLMTARAIAKECGIITSTGEDSLVMNGADFIDKIGGVVCKLCRTKLCPCPAQETDGRPVFS